VSYIKKLSTAIDDAEQQGRLVELQNVTGLSGDKLIGLLQRCAQVMSGGNVCYLEVGVFQGLTLTSVAVAAPQLKCFGIDDFSQFDADGKNRSIVEQRLNAHTSGNSILINADFEDALLSLPEYIGDRKIAVYFIDGPHDYRSQFLCLDFSRKHLSAESVIIIDDSNYEHVRRANHDWLKANPEFALLYEAYTPRHPRNMTPAMERDARSGWWNGVNVIVCDPDNSLERIYPPVDISRERYFNDHLLHATRYIESAPQLLRAAATWFPLLIPKIIKVLFSRRNAEAYISMNTRSENLMPRRKAEACMEKNRERGALYMHPVKRDEYGSR